MKRFACGLTASTLACTAVAALAIIAPVDAYAQATGSNSGDYFPTWYLGVRGNVNAMQGDDLGTYPLPKTSWNPGFGGGVSVGMKMPRALIQPLSGLSFEGEISHYMQQIDNDRTTIVFPLMASSDGERDYDVTSYMVNAYYHFPTSTIFTPYIGGGIGTADIELASANEAPLSGGEDTVAAWQGMIGLTFEEDPRALTEWNVGYRYFTTDDAEFDDGYGGTTVLETEIHSIEAGVKFRF